MIRAALVIAALAGCIDDHYTCAHDSDCNLGEAGRCELDHQCTQYDSSCPLARSYSAHSGDLSGKCFVEPSTLVDPCAAGQAAVTSDSTYGGVCAALPTCCTTGWIEACVQLAQVEYKLKCDTRLAITAWKTNAVDPMSIALYDVRYTGSTWQSMPIGTHSTFLEWIAPSPLDPTGTPRLASADVDATHLVVDGAQPFALPTGRTFDTLASVDFERSGRDTAMLSSNNITESPSDGIAHVLIDLGTGTSRELVSTQTAPLETWGDYDGDAFPDAAAGSAATGSYHFVGNTSDPDDHSRQIDDNMGTSANGGDQPTIAAFEWTDIDTSGGLDLVEIGTQIAIHLSPQGGGPLSYVPTHKIDCDPPQEGQTCPGSQMNNDVGFVGAAVPRQGAVDLVVGVDNETLDSETPKKPTFRSLVLYKIVGAGTATPTTQIPAMYAPCVGTGMAGSPACNLFRAVVARDLDHDGILDIIAVDDALTIYTFKGRSDGTYGAVDKLALQLGPPITSYIGVRVSVSGALSP